MKKEVYYDEYCKNCVHWQLHESEEPCNDCLAEPGVEDSHKPLYFEEDD